MKIVYTDYFQKSKVFLYPLLGFKKGLDFVPTETYICWDQLFSSSDYKLICVYHTEKTTDFKNFEFKYLKPHSMLTLRYDLGDKQVYVFDMRPYKYDHMMFSNGHYSKFSVGAKNKILQYFGSRGNVSEYIDSFLNPTQYHEEYAKSLDVDVKLIKEVHEVCSKPDMTKETFFEKIPEQLSMLFNKSISLKENQ